MRLGLSIALLLTCGCRQIFGVDPPDGAPGDATVVDTFVPSNDASFDASAQTCFTVSELAIMACVDQVLPPLAAVSDMQIDTDDGAFCATGTTRSDLCIVAASRIEIGAGPTSS